MLDRDKINSLLDQTKNLRKAPKNSKTVVNFIREKAISPGNTFVPNFRIYYEYMEKWNRNKPTMKLGKSAFFREFNKHFKPYRTKVRGYMLNESLSIADDVMYKSKLYDYKYCIGYKKLKNGKERQEDSKSTKLPQS
jgi:hypothetical protein